MDMIRTPTPGLANIYVISDDLIHSHDAEANNDTTSNVKVKTITINTLNPISNLSHFA